ncbi:2-hydroxyacid dehydrogenase [Haliangium ochraceum]|uniref:D-isomer specific 2-hydroxyacid dehydrogenase NAD-binding protein n=1 Tax=Haliangium ochraceum (strain DSM 14365 / JCM 11303 / SMP-2) TaxID=502025 RepID=D0LWZ5_HALO1|nr:2-hydroxyacid dehydrogenase [Haliangium ochraceum]ACY14242.1 D-isomer specific 2-hydroxyacid dehydrogenase NAD-binding protein [Haliangium ochraceum DSM 14365]
MKVLFCGSGWLSIVDVIGARLRERGQDCELLRWDRAAPLRELVGDIDVLLPSNASIGAAELAAAERLALIQQPAAGVDNIDLAAARARGIPVCRAPGANPISVAETALLLMLALARRWNDARRSFADARIGEPAGMELCGKTLGVIGMGASGRALAERARALGMRVLGTNSRSTAEELRALLAAADVISLHCPLTDATRGLIGTGELAQMKPGALLINCARGGVVERAAVTAALDSGHLGGFALDTPWEEPWNPEDPLYARPDVVALPHIAGSTRESFARIADIVVENIARLRRGEELRHRVA